MCCDDDGHSVTHGGTEVPALQDRKHLLLDTVTDALEQLGFHNIALRVDGDLDDHVPFHASRQIGTCHWGIGENFRQGRYDLVTGEGRTRYAPPGRTTARRLLWRILPSRLVRFGRLGLRFGRPWRRKKCRTQ